VDDPVVLVVDDSPTVRKIVQLTLQRERIHVVTAGDGLSALAAVADEQPDLILLDIMLPRMDGYNICQVRRWFGNERLRYRCRVSRGCRYISSSCVVRILKARRRMCFHVIERQYTNSHAEGTCG
jgi:DNA-binding NarL/FixJ family response regulator